MFSSQPLHFVTHTLTNLIPLMPYTLSLGSNRPYSLVLGLHFTTRVAPMTIRREHNNRVPKFRVDTDGETDNTTTLSLARKEWFWYHKGTIPKIDTKNVYKISWAENTFHSAYKVRTVEQIFSISKTHEKCCLFSKKNIGRSEERRVGKECSP